MLIELFATRQWLLLLEQLLLLLNNFLLSEILQVEKSGNRQLSWGCRIVCKPNCLLIVVTRPNTSLPLFDSFLLYFSLQSLFVCRGIVIIEMSEIESIWARWLWLKVWAISYILSLDLFLQQLPYTLSSLGPLHRQFLLSAVRGHRAGFLFCLWNRF